jgi:ParB family chromosome partitioning protein
MLEMALVENVQRDELNPVEIAIGYQRLIEECGLTQDQVAHKVSKSRSSVANFLRLLKLPPRLQASLRDGTLTVGHARALINVDDEEAQLSILKAIDRDELTVRDVEERVRAWHQSQEKPTREPGYHKSVVVSQPNRDTLQLKQYTDDLRTRLSTQVQIKHQAGGGGRIEIAYYSTEDLERVMELLLSA